MGLSQSLYTGYSGLSTHQKSMDSLSNNLANINTVGYKGTTFLFSSVFSKTITGSAPAGTNTSSVGGTSVGLGVTTGAILGNFRRGPMEITGNALDCYINDDKSFFIAQTESGLALTRNGSFYLDSMLSSGQRMLCVGDGLAVQGWTATNGVIDPSGSVGNIYIPSIGDLMSGVGTANVELGGVLPTNTDTSDFDGNQTTDVQLSGNLSTDGTTVNTSIYVPVTVTDGGTATVRNEIREVAVQILFSGPTRSQDGLTDDWTWTMTTVDWPNPGDPGVQIYPAEGDPTFSQGSISFYTQGDAQLEQGAGQSASDTVKPGSSRVRSVVTDDDGNTVTTFFEMPSDFTLDVSRLTSLESSPTGDGVDVWHVDGNPQGTIARSITVFKEYTDFEVVDGIMQEVRRIGPQTVTLYFERSETDDEGSTWLWRSTTGDMSGELRFDTNGALVSQTQNGGDIAFDFSAMQNINQSGTLNLLSQDGYVDGELGELSIDANGIIWGHYNNGVAEQLAMLAMGTVPNLSGLASSAGTLYYPTNVSGELMIGIAGDADTDFGVYRIGAGSLTSNALESSNVDLSTQFTTLLAVERGYQFNSRVVTTSDELLQTALGLKR